MRNFKYTVGKATAKVVKEEELKNETYNFAFDNSLIETVEEDGKIVHFCDDIEGPRKSDEYLIVKFDDRVLTYDVDTPYDLKVTKFSFRVSKYSNGVISISKNF